MEIDTIPITNRKISYHLKNMPRNYFFPYTFINHEYINIMKYMYHYFLKCFVVLSSIYEFLTFLPAAPTLAFFVPRTFFIRFFFSLACFREFLAGLSMTACRPNLYLGSNFLAKSKVS